MKPARILTLLAGLLALSLAACAPGPTKLDFNSYVSAGYIEQDVFVERRRDGGRVYRMNAAELDIYKGTPVFGSDRAVPHSPFDPSRNGPYRKGRSFEMTMGDWLAAEGIGYYSCGEDQAEFSANFRNLVPNSTYSIWFSFIAKEHMGCPDCPFASIDIPLGASDGSEAVFITDSVGGAVYDIELEPCLPLTDDRLVATLAIAYHSDGLTRGQDPGAYGRDTHVHLFTILPDEPKNPRRRN